MTTKEGGGQESSVEGGEVEGQHEPSGNGQLAGSELVDRLAQRDAATRLKAAENYRRLVVDVADESEVDPDHAIAVLDAVGRDAQSLDEAVGKLKGRRKLQVLTLALRQLRSQVKVIDGQIEAEKEQFNKLSAECQQRISALGENLASIRRQINAAEGAHRKLWEGCEDQGLLDRLEDNRAALSEASHEWFVARGFLDRAVSTEESLMADVRRARSAESLAEAQEKLERVDVGSVRERFAHADSERKRLEADQKSIYQQMVEA